MTLSLVPYDQKNTQPSFRYFGADEQLHSFEHRRWNVLVAGKSGVLFWEATIGTVSNVVLCMTTIPESFAFAAFRTAAFYPLFGFVSASLLRTALKRVVQVAVEPTAVPSTLRGFLPDEPDRDSPLSLADAAAEISRYPKIEPPSNVIAFRIPSRPRTQVRSLMIERRAKLSQGDIIGDFQVPPVPGAIEAGHTEYAIVLPHSCHFDNKGTNYCPVAVAWRLSSLQQLLDLNTDAKGNLVANKYLGKFVFAAPDIGADEYLVVDLGHIITLPTAEIVAGTKWSLDEEATLALQNAITNFFALRDITRKKMLPSFVGRTIRDIRAVPIGGNRARIEIVFTDESEDTLILYQQPVKT